MKKLNILILGLAAIFTMGSCADEDYTSKYDNPAQTTKASCDKLMTGVFYSGREYTFKSFWRMYSWDKGIIGKYAQTIGLTNSEGGLWTAQDSYADNRWSNFYNILAQYRALTNVYEGLDDAKKENDKIFVNLSEVYLYDHLSQLIDAFGDVPFDEAGYLGITGDVSNSYPSYQKASDLYKMMLNRLGELYDDIERISANIPTLAAAALPAQDFINNGDLDKWAKYCNSLRLRLAMRVASQGALTADGKAAITEILGGQKVISNNSESIVATPDADGFNYGDGFRDGYKDHSRASQEMLNVLLTEATLGMNDYRLPIMYSKNAAGEYKGLSTSEKLADQEANVALPETQRVYSRIDSTTVIYNRQLLSPIVTAAEVDFLKAEAYQLGYANGNAKQAFIDGVLHSTQFYFLQNSLSESSYGFVGTAPADADVEAYAAAMWDNATNKHELIIEQKWLNFGFMQPSQAWAEVRRTGYPDMYYPTDAAAQILNNVPNRVRYPASERNNNTANYNAQVQAMGGDDAYIKLFWAK